MVEKVHALQRPNIDLEQLRRILPQDHLLAVFVKIQLLDEVEVRTHVGDRPVRAVEQVARVAGVGDHVLQFSLHEFLELVAEVAQHEA